MRLPEPWTAAVAAAARERGITVEQAGGPELLRLGNGRHRRLVGAAMTDRTSAVGVAVSCDPGLRGRLLRDLGLPVAAGQPAEALPAGRDYHAVVVAGQIICATEWAPDPDTGSPAARSGRDVTDRVHPDVGELCRRATAAVGLDIAGVCLRLPDIAAPLAPTGAGGRPEAVITDLTTGPELCPDARPDATADHRAGRAIVDALFPPGTPSRVPTVAVAGGTTTAECVARLLADGGRRVGLAGTDRVLVADRPVAYRTGTGPWAARLVLGDPTVDVAVITVVPDGRAGDEVGYDWTDVAVIAGAGAGAGAVVAARVRDGGTLVLRADECADDLLADPRVRATHKRVVLFDPDPAHPTIRRHAQAGGCAYVLDAGWLTQLRDCYKVRVAPVDELPGANRDRSGQRVLDALAAIAAAAAHGLSPATIRRLLGTLDDGEPAGPAGTVLSFDAPAGTDQPAEARQAA